MTDIPDYILMLLNIFNNMIVEISLLRLHRVTYEGNFTGNCQKYDIFKKIAISNILNRRKNIFNQFCEQDIVPFERFRHFSCFSFILQGDTGSPWKKFQRKLLFLTVPSNKQSPFQSKIDIDRLYGLELSCPCLFQWFFVSLHFYRDFTGVKKGSNLIEYRPFWQISIQTANFFYTQTTIDRYTGLYIDVTEYFQ